MVPHAFVYGPGKAGTSSLFAWLSRDPRILTSRTKETQYFALADDPDARTYLHTCFPSTRTDQTSALEATPGYLLLPYVAERIPHVLPDARLIVCLRDPVERAISDRMHWSRGRRSPHVHRCRRTGAQPLSDLRGTLDAP